MDGTPIYVAEAYLCDLDGLLLFERFDRVPSTISSLSALDLSESETHSSAAHGLAGGQELAVSLIAGRPASPGTGTEAPAGQVDTRAGAAERGVAGAGVSGGVVGIEKVVH